MWHDSEKIFERIARARVLAGAAICLFLLWAAFAEVDEAVKGSGRTVSSGQNKIIQHLEGGIIAGILIHEGEMVEKGQVLLRVQNETNAATLQENALKLESLKAAIIRLNAEIEGEEPSFPEDLRNTQPQIVQNEQRLFATRARQREESLKILQDQIEQKKHTLAEQSANAANLKQELATAAEQYEIVQGLEKVGATSTNRMLDARAKVARFKTEIETITRSIPVTQAELDEARARLDEARASQKNELLEELNKATLESRQLQERLKADKDRQARTDLVAPVKGIVNRLYVHTIGGTVRPSEVLAEITPFDDNIIVEAKVAPEHRAKIWLGQAVKVKITAYDYAKYGAIAGTITDISADSFADEKNGRSYYRVKVALEKPELEGGKKIMPGMMSEVNILTGKRTVLNYLLRPLMNLKEDAFKQ